MGNNRTFEFFTERRLVTLTGRKARNLDELLNHLREVSGSAIFYHTHHQYLSHHFERPVFHNDFAIWASRALLEEALSEKLAAIDLLAFNSIRELRESISSTVEKHCRETNGRLRQCVEGDEFHFCESRSFIMPAGMIAEDVSDFFAKLRHASNLSLFFHFFESRLRLGRNTNDFSRWLSGRGEEELARRIDQLDPYVITLDELRREILRLGEERGMGRGREPSRL